MIGKVYKDVSEEETHVILKEMKRDLGVTDKPAEEAKVEGDEQVEDTEAEVTFG